MQAEQQTGGDSGSGGPDKSSNDNPNAAVRSEIEKLYAKHNPSKLGSVPTLLKKYEGMEQELLDSIKQKYDVVEINMDDL